MKYRVLKGAAPEIYGKDVKEDDTITLTKTQAEHLVLKGQIEPAEAKSEGTAAAEPAAAEKASADLSAPLGDTTAEPTKPKGGAGGNRA